MAHSFCIIYKAMKNSILDDLKVICVQSLAIFISLLYFELLLFYNLHNTISGITIYNVLFLVPISLVISSITCWHKKINNVLTILILFLISIFYIANLIYFKTFGSLFSISMVGAGKDAVTNFWWSVGFTIKENIVVVLLFELPIMLLIVEAIFLKKLNQTYKPLTHLFVFIAGIFLWFVIVSSLSLGGKQDYTAYGAYHSRFVDTDTASSKLGILPNTIVETRYAIFGSNREVLIEVQEVEEEIVEEVKEEEIIHKYDGLVFKDLANNTEDEGLKNICNYLNTLSAQKQNDHTGMFEGYNLIYICAESFSSMAIDEEITPTLYKLANGGIVLNNYYNAFKNVTTNGEYALLTGLWPDVAREETNMGALTGTMGQSIDNNMSEALGNKFNELGIKSRAYHNYYGSYYGRNKTLPNMGFDCKFMEEGMSFTSIWPSSDLEMMEQSIKDYINDEQFVTYYMTFSGHGNYTDSNIMVQRNIDYVKSKLNGRTLPDNALGYLACNVELDKAMEYLLSELEKAGKLDNTVIVLAGDHYPYYLSAESYNAINGYPISDNLEDYHSTCIMYNSKMEIEEVDVACCNVDILPTILNLFNIDYDSRLYAGTDIFSEGKHAAMLYNKSFITDFVKYDATTGNTIWLKDVSKMSDTLLNNYVDEFSQYVKNKYAYSIAVETYDFYNFVFDNYNKQ